MSKKLFSGAARPLIYLITAGESTAENFSQNSRAILKLIETAVDLKVDLIQIREKRLSARNAFELARQASIIARHSSTKVLVNDRADLALAAGANGVHLTSASLTAEIVRQNFPPDFVIGVSAHSIPEAEAANRQGADFVTFSPIYATPSKRAYNLPPQGIERLRATCEKLKPFPVLALGGIDETNYGEVLAAGARGFAAIRFLNEEQNLRNLTAAFGKG